MNKEYHDLDCILQSRELVAGKSNWVEMFLVLYYHKGISLLNNSQQTEQLIDILEQCVFTTTPQDLSYLFSSFFVPTLSCRQPIIRFLLHKFDFYGHLV